MDPVVHHNPSQSTLSPVSSSRRRATRENETPAQRQKREKAAERQRRKRERDRHVNNLNAAMSSYPQPTEPPPPPQPQSPQSPPQAAFTGQELSPEELARRERVRAAARERQRKHRSLVKQRKMRELGLDMTSEMLSGIEEVQFRVSGQAEYLPMLPHELGGPPPHPHAHPINPQDPASFPQPPMTAGQSFASTLLMSFQCTTITKPHLLRMLSITNEDLVTLEPIIADAFDQWDHQRRMHFAQQQAAAVKAADGSMTGPGSTAAPFADMSDGSANGFAEQASPHSAQPPLPLPHANDFRARFHRSLVAPSPFRNFNPPDSTTTATTSTPTSTPGSGPPSDPIDPHLGGVVMGATAGDGRPKVTVDAESEGVVVRP